MITEDRLSLIRTRLINNLAPTFLEVIDESDDHIGHAGHRLGGGGSHFAIAISAESLKGLSRVEAHRKVYSLFEDMMPEPIHALRIKII